LPLAFQKRNCDAPLIRFLPVEDSCADGTPGPGAYSTRAVSHREIENFQDAARQLGSSLEDLLLASFAVLLSRMTRQDTVAISVGRSNLAQFNLQGDCSFRSITSQIRNPGADGAPRSEATVQWSDRVPGEVSRIAAGQAVHYEFLAGDKASTDPQDCGLRLSVLDNGFELELASPTGLWPEEALRNWLSYLLVLLGAALREPDLPVDQLPLWEEFTARGFYEALNRTAVEFPGEVTIPGRFSLQAKRKPEAVALISGLRRYTYRELDERSTELARQLISLGAGPNRAVAVCMERSVDLPMALLAVLKSGSFYVPLDPSNPSQRLVSILEECKPVALLSDNAVAAKLKDGLDQNSLPLLRVDEARTGPEELPPLPAEIRPADLAYTIYTSGTTGKPKGVRITHKALLNLICSIWQKPGVSDKDRTLATAPISFDIATMDMFLPICSGGTLVIGTRQDALDPYRLARLITEHEITCFPATPATWRLLITSGWSGKRDLKMISGGEALPRELANDLLSLGGELWNCYGPTETTIYSGVVRVQMEPGIVPIGPPIANTSFYVMDKAGQPLPPGVPGELYIGGEGVSPGYVDLPELTAQRFVPDLFGPDPSAFLFRTGDLVRLVRGNQFEFFGRLDHQVKLRGYRIELGEIESVLRRHPSVTEAVVMLREDIPGEPRLVAYIISQGLAFSPSALAEHAAKFLPEYMLPRLIVTVDRYPLTTSGKIDRRALPIPESIPGQIAGDIPAGESASDELESKLLKIFQECLHNDSIGVTDSFFRFGGYSLLTVRLFSQIDRELHVRLPISLLFDAPTVQGLARFLRKGVSPSVIVPIRPFGRSAPLFIIQSYLLYSAMLEIVEPDRPVYGVREMGDEREPLSMAERARIFAQEILAVHPNGPLYLAGWCAAGTLTVEIARQLRETGHPVGLVALFDAERPGFTLPTGIKSWTQRFYRKVAFHSRRIRRIPWQDKPAYVREVAARNWDWAVESYYAANFHRMFWFKKHLGISLSEAAFNNVYASLSAFNDLSVRPYPGKLHLFRAADVPDFTEIDKSLGWSTVAQGGVKVDFVPGDHVSMFKKPNIEGLASRLRQELQKSEHASALG
jgi:amino acid adenylation domain-containing protein